MKKHPIHVISVGGSLVVPKSGIDAPFLRKLKALVERRAKAGDRFVIVVGGGSTARAYQDAARRATDLTRDDLDWLGVHSTRLNGHLMRTVLRDIAHPVMITDPTSNKVEKWKESVLVVAGWKPGWSTDYVATRMAKRLKAPRVINLSDIDYAYTDDPRTNPDAKPIKEMSWADFRKIVGDEWEPGMSAPFDPIASRLASRSGLEVVIANGKKLANLEKMLKGERFVGTIIGPS